MKYFPVILIGYLLGCSSMAYYIGRWKKQDVRKAGSGNLGASNTTAMLGWGAGVVVGAHDIAKAALAVFLTQLLLPELPFVGAAAGVACVMGHIFPFYLKFKGGKGTASFVGLTLALNLKLALAVTMTDRTIIRARTRARIFFIVITPLKYFVFWYLGQRTTNTIQRLPIEKYHI